MGMGIIKKPNIRYIIQVILICIYSVCIFTTAIAEHYILFVCIVGLIFLLITALPLLNSLIKSKVLLWGGLLFLLSFVYRLMGISTASIGNYGNMFLTFCSAWMGIYVYRYLPNNQQHTVVTFSSVVLIVNIIDNIRLYYLYPGIRGTGTFNSQEFLEKYGDLNIGKTAFSYSVMIFALFLLCVYINRKAMHNNRHRLVLVVAILAGLYILTYTGSGTIIISYIVSCVLLLALANSKKRTSGYFKTLLIIVITLGMILIIVFAYDWCIDQILKLEPFFGAKVTKRFEVIINIISGNYISSDKNYLQRLTLIVGDLKRWLSDFKIFLIGQGFHSYHAETVEMAFLINGDGGHSALVDLLPRYGLFGLTCAIGLIKSTYNVKNKLGNRRIKIMYTILWAMLVFNNIMNGTLEYTTILAVTLFIPQLLGDKKK